MINPERPILERKIKEIDMLCAFVKKRDTVQYQKIQKVRNFLSALPELISQINSAPELKQDLNRALEKLRIACINNNLHEGSVSLKDPDAPLESFAKAVLPPPPSHNPSQAPSFVQPSQHELFKTTTVSHPPHGRTIPEYKTKQYEIYYSTLQHFGSQIKHLNLDEVQDFNTIKQIIELCPNLETLSLRNCLLSVETIDELLRIPSIEHVKSLDISNNISIGTEGARTIAEKLSGKFEHLSFQPYYELHRPPK